MITRWGRFDPERNFSARKAVVFGSVSYAPGDVIDKAAVPLRRLRQLFDAKVLQYAAAGATKSLVQMNTEERRAWFEARGGKYDARWSDAKALEAANGLA